MPVDVKVTLAKESLVLGVSAKTGIPSEPETREHDEQIARLALEGVFNILDHLRHDRWEEGIGKVQNRRLGRQLVLCRVGGHHSKVTTALRRVPAVVLEIVPGNFCQGRRKFNA
jgi:hypothetical protein